MGQIASSNVKEWISNLRELELTTLVKTIGEVDTNRDNGIIIGGDTNGLPSDQIEACQATSLAALSKRMLTGVSPHKVGPHIGMLLRNEELTDRAKQEFKQYIVAPDTVGDSGAVGNVKRMHEHASCASSPEPDGSTICGSPCMSTTAWGGQVDQFYTNVLGSAEVLGNLGLGATSAQPPFVRKMSDHNPVTFQVREMAESSSLSQKKGRSFLCWRKTKK